MDNFGHFNVDDKLTALGSAAFWFDDDTFLENYFQQPEQRLRNTECYVYSQRVVLTCFACWKTFSSPFVFNKRSQVLCVHNLLNEVFPVGKTLYA